MKFIFVMKKEALTHLKAGGAVIYPTETAYALGGDATNQGAVDLIFQIKKRPRNKPLPLIAGSLAMVKKYCRMSAAEERLAKRYWPGPLTLVVPSLRRRGLRGGLAKGVVAKDGAIAVRVSSNQIARELSRRLGRPIVSTSANMAGEEEFYSVKEVERHFGSVGAYCNTPLQIIDGGRLPKRKPSAIVRVERGGKIKLLREGSIQFDSPPIRGS